MSRVARDGFILLIVGLSLGWTAPAAAQATPDHSMHQMHQTPPAPQGPQEPHSAAPPRDAAPRDAGQPPAGLPPVTDADRAAAFPDVKGHHVHDNAINSFVLFDQLEWQSGDDGGALSWDTKGWIGRDKDRLWFRTEGEVENGDVQEAEAHVLYGRAISRWWDIVAGVRQDMRPGSGRTWGAIGLQGLAPYWFEVEATAYVGESGVAARIEAEYELLLTNRLILQPLVEANLYGKSSPARGIGAGLSSTEVGLRLRYEFRRELAPYVGLTWSRTYGRTADLAREAGDDVSSARFAVGLRLWF